MVQASISKKLPLYLFLRAPCPIKHFPEIGWRREWHRWIQREKVSGNKLMSAWKKKLHSVTSSLFLDLWRLTVSEKIQTSFIGLGLRRIWMKSWNGFFKKCLQEVIAIQSPNFAFLDFEGSFLPLPEVVQRWDHHRWIQREKMNKVLSFPNQKRLNSIGDGFGPLAPPPRVGQWGDTYHRVQRDETDALIGVSSHTNVWFS